MLATVQVSHRKCPFLNRMQAEKAKVWPSDPDLSTRWTVEAYDHEQQLHSL